MSREQFETWFESEYKHLESSKYTDVVPHIKYGFFMAWQAATSTMEAKCAALAAELKQSQIDANCYKKGMEASNERLVQVAAENAGLKDFLHSRVDESICDKHIKTPATDAYRDELRAQGIEMAAQSDQFSMWVQQGLRSFAIGVRQGGAV